MPNKVNISYLGHLDKTMERIKGWQSKILNMVDRCTLIKSTINTYPLYYMQITLLPTSVNDRIEKGCRKFLWNRVDRSRYIARTSWDKVTRPIWEGGLGIRRLREWNMTFMAKLGWKMLND